MIITLIIKGFMRLFRDLNDLFCNILFILKILYYIQKFKKVLNFIN